MERIAFGLSGGLSKAQIEGVHKAVLAILKETGVACEHAPTAEAVAAGEGVKFEGGRLKFSGEVAGARARDCTLDMLQHHRHGDRCDTAVNR